jgi:predicted DNA-binding transcriptional regulator YafY
MRTEVSFKQRLGIVRNMLLPGKVVRAKDLADAVGVSPRSVYRYIDALRDLGMNIIGEAGVGFQMPPTNGHAKPLTQLEIYETLAASYERSALSLREQADRSARAHAAGTMHSFFAAAYTADVLRAGALDVVAKLKEPH